MRNITPVFLTLSFSLLLAACSGSKPEVEQEPPVQKAETSLIEMKPEAQKHVGMQIAPASSTLLAEFLQVTGTVQPIDSRIAEVRPLTRGRLQDVLVKVGDRVEKGEPLAHFDNIEAGELIFQHNTARSELQRLKIQLATAAKQAERNRSLSEIGAIPQKDLELSQAEQEGSLESIKAQENVIAGIAARLRRFGIGEDGIRESSTTTTITSPSTGVVIRVQAAPGEVIDSTPLFSIADLSDVWVQAEVYERDLARIRVGGSAFASVDTYSEEKFSGKVTYISDMLDPRTRTARVRCEVANPGLRLKLDMFATVALPTTFSRQVIAVPAGAVQQIEGKNVVFVRKTDSQFEARKVTVGRTVNGLTEVTEGLAVGEPVVTQGAFHLKSVALGKELAEGEG